MTFLPSSLALDTTIASYVEEGRVGFDALAGFEVIGLHVIPCQA
jgi:hypothetical protein